MGYLDELRVHAHDAAGLVELAEAEPLLGHRIAPVKAAIDRAAQVLDKVADPSLRARLLLRLAQLAMVKTDYEGAEQALAAVERHAPDHTALRFLGGVRACRVALRRGDRTSAGDTLLAAATRLPDFDDGDPIWRRVTVEVILGIAELSVEADPPDPSAFVPLADLVKELANDAAHVDAMFTGRQLLATFALSIGDAVAAAQSLRAVVRIASEAGSAEDEIEARLALAAVLVEAGDPVGRAEAVSNVQHARDRALEHGLAELHQAALIAQAGVLASEGKTAGAIDRVLELARTAVADQDVARYVAAVGIMAELYARSGDHVSAFRTIAESHRALATATGSDTTALFRPHLARLRDRVGESRLAEIARAVDTANRLADQLAENPSKNPAS